jgi:double zinc ribbon protein
VKLDRLFHQIVRNLAASDPSRLGRPLPLAELRYSVVPYRANRRALQIETSEDYELALIRLFSGETGLARTEPPDLQEEFAREAQSAHPDLDILERHPTAALHLDPAAVAQVLDPEPDLRFAPRHSAVTPEGKVPRRGSRPKPGSAPALKPPDRCGRCSVTLPVGRMVNFCPQCGQDLSRRQCGQCGNELELDWKHCVNCGTAAESAGSKVQRR